MRDAPHNPLPSLDLAAIAQRILELRDLSLREHLEAIGRSQASALHAPARDGNPGLEPYAPSIRN